MKITNFSINGTTATGMIRGMWFRCTFDSVPQESEAKKCLRKMYKIQMS